MKKTVTQATEKRINAMVKLQRNNLYYPYCYKYGEVLKAILDDLKSQKGCYGATIKECEGWGIEIPNATAIEGKERKPLHGIASVFPEYIHYTNTHGLDHLTIMDFNGLVKAYEEKYGNNYDYYGYQEK